MFKDKKRFIVLSLSIFILLAVSCLVAKSEKSVYAYDDNSVANTGIITGICQMPLDEGGYLIGMQWDKDNGRTYYAEILILDCTLLADGYEAWTYSSGLMQTDENYMWTIWRPWYGYYWTLFRLYDENYNKIDEVCYGFYNSIHMPYEEWEVQYPMILRVEYEDYIDSVSLDIEESMWEMIDSTTIDIPGNTEAASEEDTSYSTEGDLSEEDTTEESCSHEDRKQIVKNTHMTSFSLNTENAGVRCIYCLKDADNHNDEICKGGQWISYIRPTGDYTLEYEYDIYEYCEECGEELDLIETVSDSMIIDEIPSDFIDSKWLLKNNEYIKDVLKIDGYELEEDIDTEKSVMDFIRSYFCIEKGRWH